MGADMAMLVRAFGWVFTPPRAMDTDMDMDHELMWLHTLRRLIRSTPRHIMATATGRTGRVITAADTTGVVPIAAVTRADIADKIKLHEERRPGGCAVLRRVWVIFESFG